MLWVLRLSTVMSAGVWLLVARLRLSSHGVDWSNTRTVSILSLGFSGDGRFRRFVGFAVMYRLRHPPWECTCTAVEHVPTVTNQC